MDKQKVEKLNSSNKQYLIIGYISGDRWTYIRIFQI